jgi:hypothetical protein
MSDTLYELWVSEGSRREAIASLREEFAALLPEANDQDLAACASMAFSHFVRERGSEPRSLKAMGSAIRWTCAEYRGSGGVMKMGRQERRRRRKRIVTEIAKYPVLAGDDVDRLVALAISKPYWRALVQAWGADRVYLAEAFQRQQQTGMA